MNICVYGASSNEINEKYIAETEKLGLELAKRGHGLVFGGGGQGLMGAAARGVKQGGGKIVGVVPSFLNVDGIIYDKCDELIFTETMRERKQIMEDRSDAFIVTPGGFGTFEEFFEILTLKQLNRHKKPIVILNILNYYDELERFVLKSIDEKFIKPSCRRLFEFFSDHKAALDYIDSYVPIDYEIGEMRDVESPFAFDMFEKKEDKPL